VQRRTPGERRLARVEAAWYGERQKLALFVQEANAFDSGRREVRENDLGAQLATVADEAAPLLTDAHSGQLQ
jgi:hypothetical protein